MEAIFPEVVEKVGFCPRRWSHIAFDFLFY